MAIPAIGLTVILYCITAASCIRNKDYPHALMWLSYGLANCSLLWYELGRTNNSL